jgi:NNP family nitrate/nitrite transporter-like MFS transporter
MSETLSSAPPYKTPLVLGAISFAICFAAWGLISAFAPRFREIFSLTSTETAFLIAVPVLLGALARLPMGILADRFGGRAIFTGLLLVAAIPVALVPSVSSYKELIVVGFLLGLAGSSFSVGVGYVSRWTPPEKQGSALGIYGLGSIGQSLAVFVGPVVARYVGWQAIFYGTSALLVLWGVVFGLLARNAPATAAPKPLSDMLQVYRERLAWVLALFYFLTFGGFVAFSIYLPTLLKDQFGLAAADAGFRTAGFVVLATLLRPVGGILADRIGGARVLSGVFLGVVPFALLMMWPSILPFSVGALGVAALLGLGNGAVFKLVPQYFPKETGTVTGLVGAMGGLGGFFPPLVLGIFRDRLGVIWPGFLLLTLVALVLWWVNAKIFLSKQASWESTLSPDLKRTADRLRASAWATLITGFLVAAIFVGSRHLKNFDSALVIYTFAVVFSTWGTAYHFRIWLQKPPTQLYWQRGFELFKQRGLGGLKDLFSFSTRSLIGQGFIYQRSPLRWVAHQLIAWGCVLAAFITFPLVFGWIHFGSAPGDQLTYVTYLFGFPVGSFAIKTIFAWLLFHDLDVSAILVLAGVSLSLWRRMSEGGAMSVQTFPKDILPLLMLFAISVTGLGLTVSTLWMRGALYDFLAILHALTVISTLLYLPFGKLFHIIQRPAQVGIKFYRQAGEQDEGTHCVRCKERFASKMHIDDLKGVLVELGFQYEIDGPAGHWQALCPPCKRKSIATAQLRIKAQETKNI